MKRIFVLSVLSFAIAFCAMAQSGIEGRWKTINEDGTPKSIVRIFKASDGTYSGEVVQLLSKPNDSLCENCEGDLKNKPIVGMRILNELKKDGDRYVKGRILDPQNGKVYYCRAQLEDGGKKLRLRGSLDSTGLLGRTQAWIRE